jgi:cell division protein FtsA
VGTGEARGTEAGSGSGGLAIKTLARNAEAKPCDRERTGNPLTMPKPNEQFLTAIDVGSAKTCVLVAEFTENGLRYRGHGLADSRGSRKGIIVDLERAVATIQKAVERAEDSAGIPIEHAFLGVAGSHVRGVNTHGGLVFSRAREIGREEIRQAVDKARAIPLPPDREVLHLLPQEFILDEQHGVHDPLGMIATRLEVRVHMITAATSATQNVITAVNRAGVHVDDTVFEPLACADSVLRSDERELGICLADIGAGSTNLVVIQEGAVAHSAVLPVGGDHFTSDLSVGLCTPLIESEKIKKLFGNAIVTLIPEGNEVEVPCVGDRPSRMVSQRLIGEILEPRARELFEMLRENLRHAGMLEVCAAGVVISGGGSRLPGLMDIADSVLRKPVRMAWPVPIAKMPSALAEPEFATVLGMVVYGHRARTARGALDERWSSKLKSMLVGKGA